MMTEFERLSHRFRKMVLIQQLADSLGGISQLENTTAFALGSFSVRSSMTYGQLCSQGETDDNK